MSDYTAPTLTRIGSFEDVTKSLGSAREHDILGFRALIVIHPPA
ncbi:lasso RiPP family leader peptide-containing protein [Streptosporangium sp. NPDC000239]|uniref:Lasso RiPP family leader peptide-containing protein n=1 Tax=Streptosporangium jomthongense TaxID=1193683 RepID=A0ABV8F3R2_9ACTN